MKKAARVLQCPVCGLDLRGRPRPFVAHCPSCNSELVFSLSHRILVVTFALILSWAIPALVTKNTGISPIMFLFFFFPGLQVAAEVVAALSPPKYEQRGSPFLSLFQK